MVQQVAGVTLLVHTSPAYNRKRLEGFLSPSLEICSICLRCPGFWIIYRNLALTYSILPKNFNAKMDQAFKRFICLLLFYDMDWKMSVYPNGDQERNGKGYISLYLKIMETINLPLGWEVNLNFKLFLLDQIQDKYMAVQDANGKVRHFNAMKTEWGFLQLLPLGTFTDAANGYLIHDTGVFGTEVFVVNSTGRGECLDIMEERHNTHIWKIEKFSSLHDECYCSDDFTLASRKWYGIVNFSLLSENCFAYMSLQM
ncbi:MATH domain and coiled-coil domain-containing protein At1g31390-like [Rhododendron vialii]|uniref:MATH domain and coiled-coil domain-containing protein At1g31390-like n=1 Tax=Rhododendron vialii TaxID=182163 RepID=UPI00265F2709|nr:MATH domain and coiled-coil domain-containing protein At1g31390-like [Rhododendron vialii]